MNLTEHTPLANGSGPEATPPSVDDPRVAAALEEYLADLEAGRRPDRAALLARHPDLSAALARCLDGLELLHAAVASEESDPRLTQPCQPPGPTTDSAGPASGAPLGDYRILREIGRGGMGVVYEAIQLSLGRRVALKVLPFAATLDARQRQRFENEARAAAGLHHAHIVPVYAVGCERGVHYYAMQLIDGRTLAALIDEERRLAGLEGDPADAGGEAPTVTRAAQSTPRSARDAGYYRTVARLGLQAAEALEHAHGLGVVHRDVKPANLLVDAAGEVWVTDFGLARVQAQDGPTVTGDLVGTLRYMSPEQALGRRGLIDHRSDVYSLGVTLYELLTLRPAFSAIAQHELFRQIADAEPYLPRRLRPSIPVDLETIVLKACAKAPEERYQTAQDLADDLARFLDDQPIRARRATVRQRAVRWARRHRPLVASLALSAIVVLVGASLAAFEHSARERRLLAGVAQERTEGLQRALLSEASALRLAGKPGYRKLVWRNLEEVIRLGREVGCLDIDTIRAEVLACLPDPIGLDRVPPSQVARRPTVPIPPAFARYMAWRPPSQVVRAVSPDGSLLAFGPVPGPIRLWTQKIKLHAVGRSILGGMYDLAFSPDGRLLAACCEEGVIVWNVPSLSIRAFFRSGTVFSVAFHPSGLWVATAGRKFEVWSLPANRPVLSMPAPWTAARVEFSAEGNFLLAVENGTVKAAWPFRLTPEKRYLDGHEGGVPAVAFSPDGRLLASASKDRTVRFWDGRSGKLLRTCRGHKGAIEALAFRRDGKLLASGDFQGDVRLWDPTSGKELGRVAEKQRLLSQVWRLQFSPDGKHLFAGGTGGIVCWFVRDAPGGAALVQVDMVPWWPDVLDLAVHPNGGSLVSLHRKGELRLRDFSGNPPRTRELGQARAEVRTLHFDPTGRWLTFVTPQGKLGTWDWQRQAPGPPTDQRACHLAVSPDGRWVATPNPDRGLAIYDMQRRRRVLTLPPEASDVWGLSWSPDGRRLAVSLSDGSLAVWHLDEVRARLAEFDIAVPSTVSRTRAGAAPAPR
jgi:serine/threonine protein kinase/WD40 repeat protein